MRATRSKMKGPLSYNHYFSHPLRGQHCWKLKDVPTIIITFHILCEGDVVENWRTSRLQSLLVTSSVRATWLQIEGCLSYNHYFSHPLWGRRGWNLKGISAITIRYVRYVWLYSLYFVIFAIFAMCSYTAAVLVIFGNNMRHIRNVQLCLPSATISFPIHSAIFIVYAIYGYRLTIFSYVHYTRHMRLYLPSAAIFNMFGLTRYMSRYAPLYLPSAATFAILGHSTNFAVCDCPRLLSMAPSQRMWKVMIIVEMPLKVQPWRPTRWLKVMITVETSASFQPRHPHTGCENF